MPDDRVDLLGRPFERSDVVDLVRQIDADCKRHFLFVSKDDLKLMNEFSEMNYLARVNSKEWGYYV